MSEIEIFQQLQAIRLIDCAVHGWHADSKGIDVTAGFNPGLNPCLPDGDQSRHSFDRSKEQILWKSLLISL